jgi:aryl-alcohol dehydrogenase-like predicted oxidoreductase
MRQQQTGNAVTASQLCLGPMVLGTRVDERTSFEILDRFDHAGQQDCCAVSEGVR